MTAQTPKDLSRWYSNKEVLYDLFIRQDKTLKDVKAIMERDHGFPKTLKKFDYEFVLREEFGYRKKLGADEWRLYIGPEIARRRARGKASQVLLHGLKVQNIDRKISRALKSSRQRKAHKSKADTMVMPYGVVIKTPPPQYSNLWHASRVGGSIQAKTTEQSPTNQLDSEIFNNFPRRLDDLSPLFDVAYFWHNDHTTPIASSAQLLRNGCPINIFLTMLRTYHDLPEYRSAFIQAGLTITTLGKMCFDLSNHLQEETMSRLEMESMLDWIGSLVDTGFLKAFFSQEALTIRALWESLNSLARTFEHVPASNVLLSVHLSIHTQTPWSIARPVLFQRQNDMDPCLAATLVETHSYSKSQLDNMLDVALCQGSPTKVLEQLVSAGARLANSGLYRDINITVINRSRIREDQNLDTIDIARLEILLKAGAVVDEPNLDSMRLGWTGPNYPDYTTDCILLNEAQSPPRSSRPWLLLSQHSNRQQTTVTVPGIFEAISGGQDRLRHYLDSRSEPKEARNRQQALEVALSEASARGLVAVVQGLMHFGVDSNVRALPERMWRADSWHPVIRAANDGQQNTLRVLTTTPSVDFTPLNSIIGPKLNYRSLQSMGIAQRDEVLLSLSTLNLDTDARHAILLNALGSGTRDCHSLPCEVCGRHEPDLKFVDQLLKYGLGCLDRTEDLHEEAPPILLQAIQSNCSMRVLYYIVEPDVGIVSTLSGRAIAQLVGATLKHSSSPSKILKFLAQTNEKFRSDVQRDARPILRRLLKERYCAHSRRFCYGREAEKDCECVVIVKWFLELGASFESNSEPFLSELVEHGSSDSFILEMIRRGADLNIADRYGRTALQKSIKRGRLQVAVTLLERGADINAPAASSQRTALQEACYTVAPLWFITLLLDNGANVNAPPASERGYTALQAACCSGAQLSCISLLLKKGADVNAPPVPLQGLTALQFAAVRGSLNVAGLLMDHGADVNALSGYILRLSVCRYGMGRTPGFEGFVRAIDIAAFESRLDMVHFLVAAGARSYRPGRTGFDGAIELATSMGHFAVADLLREHSGLRLPGEFLQAENSWLGENPQAHMYNDRIVPTDLVHFIEREGGNTEAGFQSYMHMQLPIRIPQH